MSEVREDGGGDRGSARSGARPITAAAFTVGDVLLARLVSLWLYREVLYELGPEVRERFNQGKETAADKKLLERSVKRNCR